MGRRLGFLVLGLFCAGVLSAQTSSSLALKWDIDPSFNAAQRSIVVKLLRLFEERCVGIKKDAKDVVIAKVWLNKPAMPYRTELLGWKKEIEITLVIRDNATFSSISGHTLTYFIGSNGKPGILAQKIQAHWFFGMDAKKDSDSFMAFFPFDLIDDL